MSDPDRPDLTTDPDRPVRLVAWRLDETTITLDGEIVADGSVIYTLAIPLLGGGEQPYELRQPYRQGAASGITAIFRFHVWVWDGDRRHPTLTPSYLVRFSWGTDWREVRAHLFLRRGEIDLLSDSTVVLDLEGT